jgi:hypothetical protein
MARKQAKTELAAEADTFYSPNIRKKEQKSMALDKKSLEKRIKNKEENSCRHLISRWLDTSGPGLPLHLSSMLMGAICGPFFSSYKKENGGLFFGFWADQSSA